MVRTHTLNALEMQVAQDIAKAREEANERSRVRSQLVDDCDELQPHILGAMAEVAFGRLFNRMVDLSFEPRKGGPDFVMKSGCTVDVKATDHPEGNLISKPEGNGKAKVYVLAVVDGALVTFHGWATNEELFDRRNMRVLKAGKRPTHVVHRSRLHSMDERAFA